MSIIVRVIVTVHFCSPALKTAIHVILIIVVSHINKLSRVDKLLIIYQRLKSATVERFREFIPWGHHHP